jgi:hypothetical protein
MKGNAKDYVSTAQQFFTAYDAHDVDGRGAVHPVPEKGLGKGSVIHAQEARPKRASHGFMGEGYLGVST